MSVESDGTEKGSADLKAAGPAAEDNSAETAAISDNLAVQTFAEAAAGDSLTGKTIRLFFELRVGGYNGSTYTLTYDPESDTLKGVDFQAVAQQKFDIYFTRFK